jgi:hypothetical protein
VTPFTRIIAKKKRLEWYTARAFKILKQKTNQSIP